MCLASWFWSENYRGKERSRANNCKTPVDLLGLTTINVQFFSLSLKMSIEQHALFLINTWNIIFFFIHVSPHKKGYKEMYDRKEFMSSSIKYPDCPLLIKNVPACLLGQKTPVKTFWFDCYFLRWREKAVMRCKTQEMSLTAQDVRTKQERWKEKPRTRHYPDIIQHLHRNMRKQTPE